MLIQEKVTIGISRHNCDNIFEAGINEDGVYEIFTGGDLVQVYCEFNQSNSHWMVSVKK